MNLAWNKLKSLYGLLDFPKPSLEQQIIRIRSMERNIGLPVKAAGIALLVYFLFFSNWFGDMGGTSDVLPADVPPHEVALEVIRRYFLIYLVGSVGLGSMLWGMSQLPANWMPQIAFASAWFDALFLCALTVATGGADSPLYWLFLALIIRNSFSTPVASRQTVLNIFTIACYIAAAQLEIRLEEWLSTVTPEDVKLANEFVVPSDVSKQGLILRVSLLIVMAICSFGVQVLFDRKRLVEERKELVEAEAREYALRQQQLQAAGRLAAEIAHQLKNPLGIINNAAFTLQRTMKEGKKITQQIQIIREEVERSDRILTELMGYAQLSEGQVEKIDVTEELDRAIDRVFPAGAKYEVLVHREYSAALPPLVLQRKHVSEVFVNLLQNAREAMNGKGNVVVRARTGTNYAVVIDIQDDGPGIPADKVSRIFEPYFTTKPNGTGLGLAIVKHNSEIYGGSVEVQSELGKGTCFTITLPAQAVMRLRK